MRRALLVVGLLMVVMAPSVAAARDQRVVRDRHVRALYALNGAVLYARASGRHARWLRVVHGRRSAARRLPPGATVDAIGVDARGRVVMTFAIVRHRRVTWWAYDIGADRRRAITVPTRRRCAIYDVAIWRARTAYLRSCVKARHLASFSVLMRARGDTHVVAPTDYPLGPGALTMRGRSILDTSGDESPVYEPILNRGRRCPHSDVAPPGDLDDQWHSLGVWIGAHGMEW